MADTASNGPSGSSLRSPPRSKLVDRQAGAAAAQALRRGLGEVGALDVARAERPPRVEVEPGARADVEHPRARSRVHRGADGAGEHRAAHGVHPAVEGAAQAGPADGVERVVGGMATLPVAGVLGRHARAVWQMPLWWPACASCSSPTGSRTVRSDPAGSFVRAQALAVARAHEVVVAAPARRRAGRGPAAPRGRAATGRCGSCASAAGCRACRGRRCRPGRCSPRCGGCGARASIPTCCTPHEPGAGLAALVGARRPRRPVVVSEHASALALGEVRGAGLRVARIALSRADLVCPVSDVPARRARRAGARPRASASCPIRSTRTASHPAPRRRAAGRASSPWPTSCRSRASPSSSRPPACSPRAGGVPARPRRRRAGAGSGSPRGPRRSGSASGWCCTARCPWSASRRSCARPRSRSSRAGTRRSPSS